MNKTNEKTVWVLRAAAGAGKSTYIKNHLYEATVCSADHFWLQEDGSYRFNPKRLGEAHKACKSKFQNALENGAAQVVVDNTNINLRDMQPYVEMANEYGYKVEVVEIEADVEKCVKRNVHNVPEHVVRRMHEQFYKQQIPKDWECVVTRIQN